ncbi:MAG: 16S rRNA (cytosine(1402)-N(4))-methyltransferase RsmH [Patescibacteria group bacterium]|nr:16S rRNA (cytosine(1402)-N(4))-methyltransferase RsmH [Patescibacteria group bacterium]
MEYQHKPVMLEDVIGMVEPKSGQTFIDCTLGGGGYTLALAKSIGKTGRVLSIDLDELAISNARRLLIENNLDNIFLVKDNFRNLKEIIDNDYPEWGNQVDGIVIDLGFSSAQLDDINRGLSFSAVDRPLDMSFEADNFTTKRIVNKYSAKELEQIIRDYGEERFAHRIAKNIVDSRRTKAISTTSDLINIIEKSIPAANRHSQKIHFATRTFQALRIATNDELNALIDVLPQAIEILKPGGKLAVVSFHSLEDRIVKHFFKKESTDCLCPAKQLICNCNHQASIKILTKKPIEANENELKNNPRSRSAKLRVAEKLK